MNKNIESAVAFTVQTFLKDVIFTNVIKSNILHNMLTVSIESWVRVLVPLKRPHRVEELRRVKSVKAQSFLVGMVGKFGEWRVSSDAILVYFRGIKITWSSPISYRVALDCDIQSNIQSIG
ncbi:hypothetical protein TNCV_1781721 [Trichonephila clavipes]|nr:hypothetical protein TNCV_1781721 [Trichonephila clavipes]